jgi:hypothetical protein
MEEICWMRLEEDLWMDGRDLVDDWKKKSG